MVDEGRLRYGDERERGEQRGDGADRPYGEVATQRGSTLGGVAQGPVEASAIAKIDEAMAPPTVFVALVIPVGGHPRNLGHRGPPFAPLAPHSFDLSLERTQVE